LSAVVALGLSMAGRMSLERWPKFAIESVHRFGGILVGVFIAIHVVAVAIDAYLPFSLTSLFVPFTAKYRPVWIGLGIVAMELLVALAVTNHYRNKRLQYLTWRRLHYTNFVVWGAATLHGVGSGTDRSQPWLIAIYAAAVAIVCGLIAWRVARRWRPAAWVPRAAPILAAGVAVVLVAGAARGPLQFRPKPWNAAEFREQLKGQIQTNTGVTKGIISLAGTGVGSQNVLVRADLLVNTRKLLQTTFQMEYLPSGALCRGTVSHVQAYGFSASCRMADGSRRFVKASWKPSDSQTIRAGVIASHA
ncbi:MAG TPA: ferric reductase-like transmembrane domain-containing protein, partial [Actinomycetota bacterium]|nr:ferric reductase-like transmembrane domain-containing protein [Actinomycetota bacterium]